MRLHGSLPLACLLAVAGSLAPAWPQAPPAAGSPGNSEGPVYHIEMVLFRSLSVGGSEDWTAAPALHGTPADEAPSSSRRAGRLIQALGSADFQLNEIEAKLRSSGAYQPLAHLAWAQSASSFGAHSGFTLQQLGVKVNGLAGTVYFERGQFLHLGFEIDYSPGTITYHLNEVRRIRFYEKNYYDHPAFGVIALVTPAQGARPAGR